ncbi:DNA-directed RNA polymerase subunit beta' [endosymbiont GvMRE of Glomus versiforme]|uniref:DNA-directed RNA polymerase subunit beta' n=1 Tax=endosymbiont GvMRE of Glomus versiforme TaxID=2039283 RepID=UPI000EE151F2|nr:DNA-directed RNA polymerase subunit beta' [endosymbiont GvMRE of Glomus versiforme]RHZ35465.1 DNA-directed RNA polymerase subunit [endosymbiont GvMRE of Glomus versiforme]
MNLIQSLRISWLSPQRITHLSFGNITNHKTVNIRTFKAEPGGLFDPRIFGPSINYECHCGECKGKQNEGQVCEKCKVLVAEKNIQRWRIGHIDLVTPVVNIAIFKNLATNLSRLLGIPAKTLEDIIYFQAYVVIDNGLTSLLKKKQVLNKNMDMNLVSNILQEIIKDEKLDKKIISQAKELNKDVEKDKQENTGASIIFLENYLNFLEEHWQIKIKIGTEAFAELIRTINIKEELEKMRESDEKSLGKSDLEKLRFLQALQKNNIELEWMIIHKLPVIPCGLRPVTKLKEENTVFIAQHNNLYHKILFINNRLSEFLNSEFFFNEIIYSEKKRLQESVDQIIYGSSRGSQQNEIKSLLQSLSGKEGIIRRYSLGKRVDYSARSVIVPNPNLSFDQIGLPTKMVLALYKPFIIRKILKEKIAFTVKEAEKLLSEENPIVFSFLSKIISDHPVLANRAPSLHRLSIQGFYPQLSLSNSVELHPLITTALNADFDGDQISIHLPLTNDACKEAKDFILSSHHIIDPKNGYLISVPNQDMILGIYYLTKESKNKNWHYYDEISNLWKSYEQGKIDIHDLVVIPSCLVNRNFADNKDQLFFTTLGKIIFNEILPSSFSFYVSDLRSYNEKEEQYQGMITKIDKNEVDEKWRIYQPLAGWKKKDIIEFLNKLVKEVSRKEMVCFLDKLKKISFTYVTRSGISISPFELDEVTSKKELLRKTEKKIEQVDYHYSQGFYTEKQKIQKKIEFWGECKDELQRQLINNLEKNSNSSFYHIWNSGARASSENLAQLFVMRGHTTNYLGEIVETPIISSLWEGLSPFEFFTSVYGAMKGMIDLALKTAIAGDLTRRLVESTQSISINSSDCQTDKGILLEENDELPLFKQLYGRYLIRNICNKKEEIIITSETLLLEKEIGIIQENQITSAWVRSPSSCESVKGICQKCYGSDLSKPGEVVTIGTAVGIIAAQSLGEPGTQLTMRTFHTGGIADSEGDITQGLPKIKQILDNIKVKKEEKAILAKNDGEIINIEEKIIKQKDGTKIIIYPRSEDKLIRVSLGNKIKKGEKITVGKVDLEEYLKIAGRDNCQTYIKEEINKVYSSQGIEINGKHIEIFSRQMLSLVEIIETGDSEYLTGDIINYYQVQKVNQSLAAQQKKLIIFKNIISSLKDLSSFPSSFLAGISFQNSLKNLINYSLYRPVDELLGSKESLIAGQLIPVGTGFKEREKHLIKKRRLTKNIN